MNVRIVCSALLMTGLTFSCAAQNREATVRDAASSCAISAKYQRWIDEDVVYIVTQKERREFLALKSQREQDHFIEKFWEQRDPTPHTAQNEFKEEHYRRLAYANVNFAEKIPGWETVRGRTYIVEGPPTSITRDTSATHTTEVWRYATTLKDARTFRFVDECDCGQFKLADSSDLP